MQNLTAITANPLARIPYSNVDQLIRSRNDQQARSTGSTPQLLSDSQLEIEYLLKRSREGDQEAFRVLISRYERLIYHVANRLIGNNDQVQDLVSETYLRLCQAIGTCKNAAHLPAWISRIVVNAFYDTCRSARRHPVVSLDALMESNGEGHLIGESKRDSSPQAYVEMQERKSFVNQAVQALPGDQREIITLFYLQERGYGEIANMLHLPVGTVKSRLNRARAALKKGLATQKEALID